MAILDSLPMSCCSTTYNNHESAADCHKLSEAKFMATMINIKEKEAMMHALAKKKPKDMGCSENAYTSDDQAYCKKASSKACRSVQAGSFCKDSWILLQGHCASHPHLRLRILDNLHFYVVDPE
jgi:hypothetical protein